MPFTRSKLMNIDISYQLDPPIFLATKAYLPAFLDTPTTNSDL